MTLQPGQSGNPAGRPALAELSSRSRFGQLLISQLFRLLLLEFFRDSFHDAT
jgi:hypothetical protein